VGATKSKISPRRHGVTEKNQNLRNTEEQRQQRILGVVRQGKITVKDCEEGRGSRGEFSKSSCREDSDGWLHGGTAKELQFLNLNF